MKKSILFVLATLTILTIIKIYKIDGGFVPGQPDERTYAEVVKNFHHSFYPVYDGVALFNSPPLFHYLSYLLSFIFPGYYLPLRVLSLLSSFILAIILYLYLRSKYSMTVAFSAAVIFSVLPIQVYFSRLGLLEILISLLAFTFVICFEKSWEKSSYRWSFLTGLCLGLGVLTKYSILPLSLVPLIYFFGWLVSNIRKKGLYFLKTDLFRKKLGMIGIIYLTGLLVSLPVLYANYLTNKLEFKNQFKYIFGLSGRPTNLSISVQYLLKFPTFFTWIGTGLMITGGVLTLKKYQLFLPILLSCVLLTYALVKVGLFEIRYLVILVPFLVVFLAAGLDLLVTYLTKFKSDFVAVFVVIVLGIGFIPGAFIALGATHHTTIEQVGQYIKDLNKDNLWVTSNYWPSAFVNEVGYKTTWLTNELGDAQAFSGLVGSKFLVPNKDTAQIIFEEGGFVIVEDLFARDISNNPRRLAPLTYLNENYKQKKVFKDRDSNWPYSSNNIDRFTIYQLVKK